MAGAIAADIHTVEIGVDNVEIPANLAFLVPLFSPGGGVVLPGNRC
jgi:hypothetical protein